LRYGVEQEHLFRQFRRASPKQSTVSQFTAAGHRDEVEGVHVGSGQENLY